MVTPQQGAPVVESPREGFTVSQYLSNIFHSMMHVSLQSQLQGLLNRPQKIASSFPNFS